MSSTTRFGNLGRVFKDGESELLNGIARLSVLYEDLRLELEELRRVDAKPEEERTAADQYRVMYFLRRALSHDLEHSISAGVGSFHPTLSCQKLAFDRFVLNGLCCRPFVPQGFVNFHLLSDQYLFARHRPTRPTLII